MKPSFEAILSGGTLRSLGNSGLVLSKIKTQSDFDALFKCLYHKDRVVVMRAADIIEKITVLNPQYLSKHKKEIIEFSKTAIDKELKWHIALLIPRFHFSDTEFGVVWNTLTEWALDKSNSRIVRVHSMQGLFDMMHEKAELEFDFRLTLQQLDKENIPSLKARIKKIKKQIENENIQ